ncbi:MAG: hypothetical protein ACYC3B_05910 [Sedimentisphaerales bacterium]
MRMSLRAQRSNLKPSRTEIASSSRIGTPRNDKFLNLALAWYYKYTLLCDRFLLISISQVSGKGIGT